MIILQKFKKFLSMAGQYLQLQQEDCDQLNEKSISTHKQSQKGLYVQIQQLLRDHVQTIFSYVILAFLITMIIGLLYSQGPFVNLPIKKVKNSNQASIPIGAILGHSQNNRNNFDMIQTAIQAQTFMKNENGQTIFQKQDQLLSHSQLAKITQKINIEKNQVLDELKQAAENVRLLRMQSSKILTNQMTSEILRESEKEYHQDMLILKPTERAQILDKYISMNAFQPLKLLEFNNILNRTSSKIEKEHFERLSAKYDLADYNQVNSLCVLLTTHNNARSHQIIKTLNSIYNQHYKNVEVVIVDRASIDQTTTIIQQYINKNKKSLKPTKMIELENYSEVYAISRGIKQCKPDSISILMNGNSQLIGKSTFKIIDKLYQENDIKVAYSSQFLLDTTSKTLKLFEASDYGQSEVFMLLYRLQGKRYDNFFTFRSNFGHNVPDKNLHFHGSYFEFTGADAFTKSVIEQGCGKVKVIEEPLLFSLKDSSIQVVEKDKRRRQQIQIGMKSKLDFC